MNLFKVFLESIHGFPLIIFMVFHEFEKSQAEQEQEEEEQEQFSNFKDRGFALAVKNQFEVSKCAYMEYSTRPNPGF